LKKRKKKKREIGGERVRRRECEMVRGNGKVWRGIYRWE